MTDWLDPEAVRAERDFTNSHLDDKYLTGETPWFLSLEIVRAIAALPEPAAATAPTSGHGWPPHVCEPQVYAESDMRRIWRACRAALGEES